MATKEFVGPVDCYGALLPDEEYFLLMGRDPLMPGLTMIWASLRVGDFKAASNNFMRLCDPNLVNHYANHPDVAKSEEAVKVAERGVAWRERNLRGPGGKPTWKDSRAVGIERVVVEYVERRGSNAVTVRKPLVALPLWARSPIVTLPAARPTIDAERIPPDEIEGDCS